MGKLSDTECRDSNHDVMGSCHHPHNQYLTRVSEVSSVTYMHGLTNLGRTNDGRLAQGFEDVRGIKAGNVA